MKCFGISAVTWKPYTGDPIIWLKQPETRETADSSSSELSGMKLNSYLNMKK